MKKLAAGVALIAVVVLVTTRTISGTDTDCTDDRYMHGIEIVEERVVSSDRVREAEAVALEHSLNRDATIQATRYGVVQSDVSGMEDGALAFVVAIPNDRQVPAAGPIGAELGAYESPCEIVVVSDHGEYLFSKVASFAIDEDR